MSVTALMPAMTRVSPAISDSLRSAPAICIIYLHSLTEWHL